VVVVVVEAEAAVVVVVEAGAAMSGLAAGGLIGLALSWQPAFCPVSVPRVLWTWFVVITTLAAGDLYCDYHDMQTNLAKLMDVLSELVELMIAMAASLYLYLKSIHLPVEVSAAQPPGN